jgi:hypothetical protein
MSVAHRFTEGHDIRHDPIMLVAPHVVAHAAETRLDLISDVKAAGCTHMVNCLANVARWDMG